MQRLSKKLKNRFFIIFPFFFLLCTPQKRNLFIRRLHREFSYAREYSLANPLCLLLSLRQKTVQGKLIGDNGYTGQALQTDFGGTL